MIEYEIYVIGLLLLFNQELIGQESPQIQSNPIIDTIPFQLTDHNNLSIKAIINKLDTVDMMFHTAASGVTLISEVAKSLTNINWIEGEKAKTWGGEHDTRFSESNTIQIGGFLWDNIPIWEDENSGPTTDGKFGPNLFQGKAIEIDFDNGILIIQEVLPDKITGYNKIPLLFERDLLFIEGTSTISGKDYVNRFLIHSGYGGAILYDDQFVAESKIGDYIEIVEEQELNDSFGNVLKVKKGRLPKFTIGGDEFKDIPVGFFEGIIGKQRMSVLGGNLLKRFNLIIDSERKNIYMIPNQFRNLSFADNSQKKSIIKKEN